MRLARSKPWKGALAILALIALGSLGVGVVVGAGLSVWRGSAAQRAVGVQPDRAQPSAPRVVTVPQRPVHRAPQEPPTTITPAVPPSAPAPVVVHRVKSHSLRQPANRPKPPAPPVVVQPVPVPAPPVPAPPVPVPAVPGVIPAPINPAGHRVPGHPAAPALAHWLDRTHWRDMAPKDKAKWADFQAKAAVDLAAERAKADEKLVDEQAKAAEKLLDEQAKALREQAKPHDEYVAHHDIEHWTCKPSRKH